MDNLIWALVVIGIAGFVYMLPTVVATERKVTNVGSIAVINVLLGWTLIGWAVAMAMAARTVAPRADAVPAAATFDCPHCLEPVKVGASVCPHCQRDIVSAPV